MEIISYMREAQSSFYGIKLNVPWDNTMGIKWDLLYGKQKKILGDINSE